MDLIDTHCHLDVEGFEPDREAVIARARAAGVAAIVVPAIVVPAIHAAGWQGLLALCASGPGLHPAFGLPPWGRR
jgi:TatD DNase family protein